VRSLRPIKNLDFDILPHLKEAILWIAAIALYLSSYTTDVLLLGGVLFFLKEAADYLYVNLSILAEKPLPSGGGCKVILIGSKLLHRSV